MAKIGIACRAEYDAGGHILSAKAPDGSESQLFKEAYIATRDREMASQIWATAYTDGYIKYDNWISKYKKTPIEPTINDVMSYIKMRSYMAGDVSKEDINSISGLASSIYASSYDIPGVVSNAFYINGNFIVNEDTLKRSNLYTNEEIERILSDENLQEQVTKNLRHLANINEDSLEKVINIYGTPIDKNYLYSEKLDGVYDSIGRSVSIPGDIVIGDVRDALSKADKLDSKTITDELNKRGYSRIENMVNESEESMSVMFSIANDDTYGKLQSAKSTPIDNEELISVSDKLYNSIDKFIDSSNGIGAKNSNSIKLLHDVQIAAAKDGIDLAGVEMLSEEDRNDILFGLQAVKDNPNLSKSFKSLRDNLLGAPDNSVAVYSRNVVDVVRKEHDDGAGEESFTLDGQQYIYTGTVYDGLREMDGYAKVVPSEDTLHNLLFSGIQRGIYHFPVNDRITQVIDKYQNKKNLEDRDIDAFVNELNEAMSYSKLNTTEILNKLVYMSYGKSPKSHKRKASSSLLYKLGNRFHNLLKKVGLDIFTDNAKSVKKANDIMNSLIAKKIEAKINHSPSYDLVWRFINLEIGAPIGVDPRAATTIKTQLDKETLDEMNTYSFLKPSMDTLTNDYFSHDTEESFSSPDDMTFKRMLFYRMPWLSGSEYKGTDKPNNGRLVANNEFRDFISVDNVAYMKIGETGQAGVYTEMRMDDAAAGSGVYSEGMTQKDMTSPYDAYPIEDNVTSAGRRKANIIC